MAGIPYKFQGRSPIIGFDCWGLVLWMYQRGLEVTIPDIVHEMQIDQEKERVIDDAMDWYSGLFKLVDTKQPIPSDLVVADSYETQRNHAAVVTEPGWAIHAHRKQNIVRIRINRLFNIGMDIRVFRYDPDDPK